MALDSREYLEHITDDAKWDELVFHSLESSPFLMSSFLRSIGQENSRLVLCVGGEAVIGTCLIAPLSTEAENSHAFCVYQGAFFPNLPLSNYSDENERLRRLQKLIRCLDVEGNPRHLSFHPLINDLRAIDWFYYEAEKTSLKPSIRSRYTGFIQIQEFSTFEKYLTTIRRERLREFKRSLESEYQVQLDSFDIENFLKLYSLTFERQGHSVPKTVMKRVSSIISAGLQHDSGKLKMLYSEKGEAVSGAYILSDRSTDVYLFGANNTHFRDSYGSTRLLLESLRESFQQSKKIFDFCGMNSPNRGEFKSSFNARVMPYFELDLEVREDA